MKDFLLELRLAIADYFCGEVTEQDGKIALTFENGQTFLISVEEVK